MQHGVDLDNPLLNAYADPVEYCKAPPPGGSVLTVTTIDSYGNWRTWCSHGWATPREPYLLSDEWAEMYGCVAQGE